MVLSTKSRTSTSRPSCAVTADLTGASAADDLRRAHQAVSERIARACRRAGRAPAEVGLLAISKAVPAERLQAAVAAGITELGENRVQEAESKSTQVAGAQWHLVGHLQANKAGRAIELFDTIQSVDSLALAERLDRLCAERGRPRLGVYLQVNIDHDQAKQGYLPEALPAELSRLAALPHLALLGLMTVGRLVADAQEARPTFARLRALSERLHIAEPRLGPGLSMGMSDDFEVAVEEGATLVRVGRAIFGARPTAG